VRLDIVQEAALRVAKETLAMPDEMAGVMGGPTKNEARRIIQELDPPRPWKGSAKPGTVLRLREGCKVPTIQIGAGGLMARQKTVMGFGPDGRLYQATRRQVLGPVRSEGGGA